MYSQTESCEQLAVLYKNVHLHTTATRVTEDDVVQSEGIMWTCEQTYVNLY